MVGTQNKNLELNPILGKHEALVVHGLLGAEVWPVVAREVDLGDFMLAKEVTPVFRTIGGIQIEVEDIWWSRIHVSKDQRGHQSQQGKTCDKMSVGTSGLFITAQVVKLKHSKWAIVNRTPEKDKDEVLNLFAITVVGSHKVPVHYTLAHLEIRFKILDSFAARFVLLYVQLKKLYVVSEFANSLL